MSVSSVAAFLQNMESAGFAAFGHELSPSEWRVLLSIGQGGSTGKKTLVSGQSYKALKCICALSDDTLSRSLRHLLSMGLIERSGSAEDQRVIQYRLSPGGHDGLVRIGWEILQQASALFVALSLPLSTGGDGVGG